MRIAYLTQAYPPVISGAAIFAHQLAETMVKRGHQVLVIAPSGNGQPGMVIQGGLSILNLRSFNNPLRVRQRFMLYPRKTIMSALKKFQPDVIHTHDSLQVGMIGLTYARRTGIPIITTTHQLPWFVANHLPDKLSIRKNVEDALWGYARWLLRQYTVLVTPTQTVSDTVRRRTGLGTQVISYGVDQQKFRPPLSLDEKTAARKKLNLPPDVPVLLHVGQLHTAKRVEYAIRSAAQAMQNTNAHLLVVGDGPQRVNLIKICTALGIADRAHFPGFITAENGLPEVYRLADMFITASEIETQGIVLLEAAASGLPIVAVNATCIYEIVHDRVNGFLAQPGDTQTINDSIMMLMDNPKKASMMGQEGRILAEGHSAYHTWSLHEKLYYGLVKQQVSTQRIWLHQWELVKAWNRLKSIRTKHSKSGESYV